MKETTLKRLSTVDSIYMKVPEQADLYADGKQIADCLSPELGVKEMVHDC